MKKVLKIILLMLCTLSLCGCNNEKVYKSDGMSITMPKGFRTKVHNTANAYYENNDVFIIALKEKFSTLEEIDINSSTPLEEYANLVLTNTQFETNLINENGLLYFTYEYETTNTTYYYVSTLHKGKDAFWVCNFACKLKDKETYHPQFIKWAKSITFK